MRQDPPRGGLYLPDPLDRAVMKRLHFLDTKYPDICQKVVDEQWKLGNAEAKILRSQRDAAIDAAERFPYTEVMGGVGAGLILGLIGALALR